MICHPNFSLFHCKGTNKQAKYKMKQVFILIVGQKRNSTTAVKSLNDCCNVWQQLL